MLCPKSSSSIFLAVSDFTESIGPTFVAYWFLRPSIILGRLACSRGEYAVVKVCVEWKSVRYSISMQSSSIGVGFSEIHA